ncbi:PREDICTED: cytochrome b561 isoform X2 [Nicrophorus vespilloides]|uniref:Cytochrome b561 isoform X2 n=1 Tax=Nicrophorus vespilloides TaxID=110193 RepID=A0ABM1MBN6_NICVS|nr:PREDICTED: cytochrome b561 isoform X2 [Nicrophorus vespilloides]
MQSEMVIKKRKDVYKKVGKMEARAEHQSYKRYKSLYTFTSLVGCSLIVLIVVWCVEFRGGFAWKSNPKLQFNWHPLMMTIGLIFMFSQAMLIYRTGRGVTKRSLKILHGFIHLGAFVCSVFGLVAVFDFHNNSVPPKANLYTLHSWLGLICVIMFTLQLVGGFVTFMYPGLSREIRKISLPVHVAVGISLFVLSVCTAFMGLQEKAIFAIDDYASFSSESLLVNFTGLILALYATLVLYLVNNTEFKRTALPEEELALSGHTE